MRKDLPHPSGGRSEVPILSVNSAQTYADGCTTRLLEKQADGDAGRGQREAPERQACGSCLVNTPPAMRSGAAGN